MMSKRPRETINANGFLNKSNSFARLQQEQATFELSRPTKRLFVVAKQREASHCWSRGSWSWQKPTLH